MADHVIVSKFTYILYISRIYPTFSNKNSMQKKQAGTILVFRPTLW